ncbi:Ig-like domain-containing protein [Roseimaritima ulvae]|nr:Ig-like domain-containing protein [Roseimaritima ulvae]
MLRVERLGERRMLAADLFSISSDTAPNAHFSTAGFVAADLGGNVDVPDDSAATVPIGDSYWNPLKAAIQGVAVLEGHDQPPQRMRVVINQPLEVAVTVAYVVGSSSATVETATAGADYRLVDGAVVIPAGDTEVFLDLAINDDSEVEYLERFSVELVEVRTPQGEIVENAVTTSTQVAERGLYFTDSDGNVLFDPDGTLIDGYSFAFIADDESGVPPPWVDVDVHSMAIQEGSDAVVEVELSQPFFLPLQFDYQTIADTATAVDGSGSGDFVPMSGQLEFAAGQTSASFTIPTIENTDPGSTKKFAFQVTNPWWHKEETGFVFIRDDETTMVGEARQIVVDEGTEAEFWVASFVQSESSLSSDYSVSIDWGDGKTTTGSVRKTDSDSFKVFGRHRYLNNGTFDVAVTIFNVAQDRIQKIRSSVVVENVAPIAVPHEFTVSHNRVLTVGPPGLKNGIVDPGDDFVWVELVQSPAHGHAEINSLDHLYYDPDNSFVGTDTLYFAPRDGDSVGEPVPVTIRVTNATPTTSDARFAVRHDRRSTIPVEVQDRDGDTIQYHIVAPPAYGMVTMDADETIAYTPTAGYTGGDTFSYYVSDGLAESNIATVELVITNAAPVALDSSAHGYEDQTLILSASDFSYIDEDNDSLQFVEIVSVPERGSLMLKGAPLTSGQVVSVAQLAEKGLSFIAAADEHGTIRSEGEPYAHFSFKVHDGLDRSSNIAQLCIDVQPIADAPTTGTSTATTTEDTPYTLSLSDVVYADADLDAMQYLVVTSLPQSGRLTINGNPVVAGQRIVVAAIENGHLQYVPSLNQHGPGIGRFTFAVADVNETSSSDGTIVFNVDPVNDPPTVEASQLSAQADEPLVLSLADFGYQDPEGEPLRSIVVRSIPDSGLLTLDGATVVVGTRVSAAELADGSFRYIPAAGSVAPQHVSFKFTASDGVIESYGHGLVSIAVGATNSPPVPLSSSVVGIEDHAITFAPRDFRSSDSDGDILAGVKITRLPLVGELRFADNQVVSGQFITIDEIENGNLTFVPGENAHGFQYDSLEFAAADFEKESMGVAELVIDVRSVNDVPLTMDMPRQTLLEDRRHYYSVDDFPYADADGDSMHYVQIETLPKLGNIINDFTYLAVGDLISVSDIAAGKVWYRPYRDGSGADYGTFRFRVSDGQDLSETVGSVTYDVVAVNDVPSSQNSSISIVGDEHYIFKTADFPFDDRDGDPLAAVQIVSVPGSGYLLWEDRLVEPQQMIAAVDIEAGKLRYWPATGTEADARTELTFAVSDSVAVGQASVLEILIDQPTGSIVYGIRFLDEHLSQTLDAVEVGETFYAVVDIAMKEAISTPLFSGSLNIELGGGVFSIVGEPEFAQGFDYGFHVAYPPDASLAVGAIRLDPNFFGGEFVRIPLRAEAVGTGAVAARDINPDFHYGTTLFAQTNHVSADRLQHLTETIAVIEAPYLRHNSIMPTDVDGDGSLTPFDVLLVVNELNRNYRNLQSESEDKSDATGVPSSNPEAVSLDVERRKHHFDVSGDGLLSPYDVLKIVNELNRWQRRR